jgi:hypothetical protein
VQLRLDLAALEHQQRDDVMRMIVTAFPAGDAFNAIQIWRQPELRAACEDADIHSPQQLGVWLRSWCDRIGRDGDGTLWSVAVNDLHEDAGVRLDDDV